MGVGKGTFWTVLRRAFCPVIRKVLVGRELGFVDKCAFWGANWGLDLVSCFGGGVLGEGKLVDFRGRMGRSGDRPITRETAPQHRRPAHNTGDRPCCGTRSVRVVRSHAKHGNEVECEAWERGGMRSMGTRWNAKHGNEVQVGRPRQNMVWVGRHRGRECLYSWECCASGL